MAKKAKKAVERTVASSVDEILNDERVVWFPIKHFSPSCSHHVAKVIRDTKPAAVLVEGPQDATSLIPYIIHPDSRAPFTVFSSYVDRDNQFGLNGTLSASETIPARYRAWWPMTDYAPEYVALKVGAEVGAKLEFCDLPLIGTIPYHHVPNRDATQKVDDAHLAHNSYFEAIRKRQRRRSFDEFWNANFETGGWSLDTRTFMRNVLAFAYCARMSSSDTDDPEAALVTPHPGLVADGTIAREGHMRYVIDSYLKEFKTEKIVVVTGAFHSVALPWTKKNKSKARVDKNLDTLLTPHSFHALANLYSLNRLPAYQQAVWDQLSSGAIEPFNTAALKLIIEVMRAARGEKESVSTADAVGAWRVARNLATLRGNGETTLEDLTDAVQMGYVKGDVRLKGAVVERVTREALVGTRLGKVTSEAGQAPLVRDYYAQCKAHKIDITGVSKVVRCDLGKHEGHRLKSAFLHQCNFLEIPMFSALEDTRAWDSVHTHYKGPDISTGQNLHLIGETWGIKWREKVDDRLLELSDRGASLAQASGTRIRELLVAASVNAADTTRLLLRSAQMGLSEMFDEILTEVEAAIHADSAFENLVKALNDFVALYSYRDNVATEGHARLIATIVTVFNKATMVLPTVVNASGPTLAPAMEALQTLVRITLTFEGVELDRQLLIDKLFEMVAMPDGTSTLRGAGYGVLFSFGATREKVVARELDGYLLGAPEQILQAGGFLDGLFVSARNIFMGSPRLMRAISAVLKELDWTTFKILLPDLRRAFTQFIPAEIDQISQRVGVEVGIDQSPSADVPIPAAMAVIAGEADARVAAALEAWW